MTLEKTKTMKKALRYWAASYVLVAAFLFYHSGVDLISLLLGGIGTLVITLYFSNGRS